MDQSFLFLFYGRTTSYPPAARRHSPHGRLRRRGDLKVEDVGSWYAPLVAHLGVGAAAAAGWQPATKFWPGNPGGCFMSPKGVPCADALRVAPPAAAGAGSGGSAGGGGGGVAWAGKQTTGMARNQHADAKLKQYYTPAITLAVTRCQPLCPPLDASPRRTQNLRFRLRLSRPRTLPLQSLPPPASLTPRLSYPSLSPPAPVLSCCCRRLLPAHC